jgi:uncharacterized DUF497 family protein
MDSIRFTWDSQKNRINQQQHDISFDEVKTVFFDEYARLISDPDHSQAEERFLLLGLSARLRLLVVSHTYRSLDSEIRIISARKANRREQQQYGRLRR